MNKRKFLLLLIIVLLIISGCGKKEEKEKEEENSKPRTAIVIEDTNSRIIQLDDNFDLEWSYKIRNHKNGYHVSQVDGNYIYYVDDNRLYRRNMDTKEEEDLEIQLDKYWFFSVNGNDLIYNVLFDTYHVSLDTKKVTKLKIDNNNTEVVKNKKVYYTSKANSSLKVYYISSGKTETIAEKGRIIEDSNNYILYVNGDNEYIVYNTDDNSSNEVLEGNEYAFSSNSDFPMHIYKEKFYYAKDNKIVTLKTNKEIEYYKSELKDNETIKDFFILGNDKMVLSIFVEDKNAKCDSEICEPQGDNKYILVNVKNKKETTIKNNTDIFELEYYFHNVY